MLEFASTARRGDIDQLEKLFSETNDKNTIFINKLKY